MIRNTLVAGALTAGLIVTGGGVASAHECYIANRSDKGNAGASHSANWYTLHLSELYTNAHFFLGGEPLTPAQVSEAVSRAEAAGIPTSVTLFERFTIPRNLDELEAVPSKATDGKGVDHFFSKYGDQLVGIFFSVRGS